MVVTARFNHTIVLARDQVASATFLAETLGLEPPVSYPPFSVVTLANDVSLDFMTTTAPIVPQHYAFLVSEVEFDHVMNRLTTLGLDYWAGPGHSDPGRINHRDGGRGVYFDDPDGHSLEALTRPYGGVTPE